MKTTPKAKAIQLLARDLERELLAAQIDLAHTQRRAALMQVLGLSDTELADAIGCGVSTLYSLRADGDAPRHFNVGDRNFTRPQDLIEWAAKRVASAATGDPRTHHRRIGPSGADRRGREDLTNGHSWHRMDQAR